MVTRDSSNMPLRPPGSRTIDPDSTARHVFIVDDDAPVRAALSLLVRSYGWNAHCHHTAESFLSAPAAPAGSCVLLDLDLPGLNGAEVCERVIELEWDLHIFIVTAHHDHPMAAQALRAGALEVLPKPVDAERLAALIRAL